MRVVAEVVFPFSEPHGINAIHQRLEGPVQLAAREGRAQTVVLARAECHMSAGVRSLQVDHIGIIKAPFITVGGGESDIDQAPRRDRDTTELDVLLRWHASGSAPVIPDAALLQ